MTSPVYSFDPLKAAQNRAVHGVDFAAAEEFQWATSRTFEDTRRDYGERRFVTIGLIDDRLHVMVHTPRGGTTRLVSLRKANDREIKRYEQAR